MKTVHRLLASAIIIITVLGFVLPAAASEAEASLADSEYENLSSSELEGIVEERADTSAVNQDSAASTADEFSIPWTEPGNSDLNILSGGRLLMDGTAVYYSGNGIYCERSGETTQLCADCAYNLNLFGDWIYYTTEEEGIKRVSLSDLSVETVYTCSGISQMYVIGSYFCYLKDGLVFAYNTDDSSTFQLDTPEEVIGFIPTQYGFIYLTGEAFSLNIWCNGQLVYEGVESCYTDSGYLVINTEEMQQVSLEALFSGDTALSDYTLHQDEVAVQDISESEQLANEAAYLESDFYNELLALGETDSDPQNESGEYASDSYYDGSSLFTTAQEKALAAQDMNTYNITRRSRQMAEVIWTAKCDILAWGGTSASRTVKSRSGTVKNYFAAGQSYMGIPYSQAVAYGSHTNAGYVGWNLSVDEFIAHTQNTGSLMYTAYSVYNKTAPYYGSDCSGFVSWAWDLPCRCTCSSLVYYSDYIGTNLNQIRVGDCLNKTTAHVLLVSDIGYDKDGNIISIELTEQTPLKMKVTNYGVKIPGKANDEIVYVSNLNFVQTYYLNNGYVIYRRNCSRSVSYTPSAAVPLAEDNWLAAPTVTQTTDSDGQTVLIKLSHSKNVTIHYTTDGTEATLDSPVYSEAISITSSTVIHAIADYNAAAASGAHQLSYYAEVNETTAPSLSCISGCLDGTQTSTGSVLSLVSDPGAKIYYTTDGSEPTFTSNTLDSAGIKINEAVTIKAFALLSGCIRSKTSSFSLTLSSFHQVTTSISGSGTVSPSGVVQVADNGSKTFTFTPATNYWVYDVLVDGVSVGAVNSYTFSDNSADHTLSVTFARSLPFTDVSYKKWYADEVAFVYENGLFNGTTSTQFGPNGKMTRGMFATVLGRFAGVKSDLEGFNSGTIGYTNGYDVNVRQSYSTSSSVVTNIASKGTFLKVTGSVKDSSGNLWYKVSYNNKTGYIKAYYNGNPLVKCYSGSFTDISGKYYSGYIQWAHYNGLISGVSSTSFAPDKNITRQDICVILYSYLTKYKNISLSTGNSSFTDESSISSYAKTAVHALANIGIVSGYKDGTFGPKQPATRAEVAAMFMRLYQYLNA